MAFFVDCKSPLSNMPATHDRLRLAQILAFSLPKILTHLMIAVFVLAGALSGHHGHLDFGGSHPSSHSSHLADDPGADPMRGKAGGQSDPDKTSCDFSHFSSCGMGHCCFPVPSADLAQAKADRPVWEDRVATWERREERLEPPPPKWT